MAGKKGNPLYRVIYNQLKEDIATHKYLPEEQLPTESELAQMFQVSLITSKRALTELERDGFIHRTRGKGSFVNSPSVVQTYASQQRPLTNSEAIVSMILPSQGYGFSGYIQGAADYLNKCGYHLSVHIADESMSAAKQFLLNLQSQGIRTIIYYPQVHIHIWDILMSLHLNQNTVITIDQYLQALPLSSVVSDNFQGGYLSASRLIELGHKRIAFISCSPIDEISTVRDRYMGYCTALKEHGLPIDSEITMFDFVMEAARGEERESFGRDVLKHLMDLRVTAIQAEHDVLASQLLRSAMELGIQVPSQLSILGFDNIELGAHLTVPLSTVEQDFYGIGRKAAELAVQSMESGTVPQDVRCVIPVKLIERGTTGEAPPRETTLHERDGG